MALRGELLDKPTYTVIQTIMEGNTAICYKCWHEVFERWCAQKTISILSSTQSLALQEPQLLRSFEHPHLTEIWEAQWDPDYGEKAITFTMPYYEGGSLHSVLMEGHVFSVGESISLACDILDALHFLHVNKSIVHRDIKPGNVFLAADLRTAYLGDLGGAAFLGVEPVPFEGGTPLYRAPEAKVSHFTVQSDLYSCGLVLREILGGRFPYEDIDPDDVDRRLAVGQRTLPSRLLTPPPYVPGELIQVISKLLAVNPEHRPRSALDVQRALQNIRHVDWRPIANGGEQKWVGEAVPRRRGRAPREVEVIATTLRRGRNSGNIELTARWRERGSNRWRGMNAIKAIVNPDDQAGWRAFFKSASTAMLQFSARR